MGKPHLDVYVSVEALRMKKQLMPLTASTFLYKKVNTVSPKRS